MKYTTHKKISALFAVSLLTTLNAFACVFDFETVSQTTPITSTGTAVLENNGWGYTFDFNTYEMVPGSGFTSQVVSSTGVVGTMKAPGKNYGGFVSNATGNVVGGADVKLYDAKSLSATGADGSSNFGVIMTFDMMAASMGSSNFTINGRNYYGDYTDVVNDTANVSFMFGESLNLTSIDVSLTAYTHSSMVGGDSFVPSDKTLDNEGQFYAIRIYGIGEEDTLLTLQKK